METDTEKQGNDSQPDLSVIIPVFNGEKELERCVKTLFGIKDISYEVIIINDCSTDGTPEVAERMSQNPAVSWHSLQEHAGQSAARNMGISRARGRWVIFLDVDDLLLPAVTEAVRLADDMKADVLHMKGHLVPIADRHIHFDDTTQLCLMQEFNLGNQPVLISETSSTRVETFLRLGILWNPVGKLYRREFLLKHDIRFPEDMHLVEGMFFQLPCVLHAERYAVAPYAVYLRYETESSLLKRKRTGEDLREVLENEARGLKRLEEFFHEMPSQEFLPLAKDRFCAQMDQVIGPISLAEPEIWGKIGQEGISLFQDPWWLSRHLGGMYRDSTEKQALATGQQQQKNAVAATEELLDMALKAPRIIVVASVYTMYLCTLYFRDWDKSIFVCAGGIPSSIVQNIRKLGILCYGKGDGFFINDDNAMRCLVRYAKRNHIPIYGNDDPPEAGYFIDMDFTVVEDGTANYQPEGVMKQKHVKRIAPNGEQYVPFGFSHFVKHVLLTGKQAIPDILKKKAERINTQKLWDQKNQREQDKILALYSFPRKEIEQQLRKGRDCLLIGIPHSAIGLCKEEQEIAMYRDMMEPYGQKRFLIKPHHQNKIDFEKYFPDCYVLPKHFPIDLAKLLGLKFHRVVGADSSALYRLFPPKIVEDRKDLMEKNGVPRINIDPPEEEK